MGVTSESYDNAVQRGLFKVRMALETAGSERSAVIAARAFAIACDSPTCGLLRVVGGSSGPRTKPEDFVRALVAEVASHIVPDAAATLRDVARRALIEEVRDPGTVQR